MLIIFTTVINALGVKLMARINSAGVFIELIAAVLLIILLAVNITRGPDVLFDTQGTGEGHDWGYLGAFLTAALASAYVMYGFDTASSLGEETLDPRRTAPKAILRAVVASFLLGGSILLFAILSVSNINSPEIAEGGLQFVVLDVLGDTVGKIFLICVAIAITVCCLAVQTATIRMMFAMARDNNLPAGERLAKVHPKTKTPIVPAVLIGFLAILILVVNIRQPQIFTVITSIGIIMIYIAYLLVTVPMLFSRLRGEWPPKDAKEKGYFSLGKLGLPINILAVVWGAGMAINLAWPRKDVYNATEPFHWYLQYGAMLFIGVVFFGGLAYYWFVQRHKTGVLASHAAEAPAPAAAAPPNPAQPAGASCPPRSRAPARARERSSGRGATVGRPLTSARAHPVSACASPQRRACAPRASKRWLGPVTLTIAGGALALVVHRHRDRGEPVLQFRPRFSAQPAARTRASSVQRDGRGRDRARGQAFEGLSSAQPIEFGVSPSHAEQHLAVGTRVQSGGASPRRFSARMR